MGAPTDEATFDLVAAERLALADLLDSVGEARWDTPSLCAGWRVRDVVAHLLMDVTIGVPRFLLGLAAHRFSFDRFAYDWAVGHAGTSGDMARALRDLAHHRFTPPGAGPESPLTHLVTHGQDIRRPLGLVVPIPAAQANVTLDQLVSDKARGLHRGRIDGLTLSSLDTGWTAGTGRAVRGTASALITTIAGRPAALDELDGDGVDTLRARFATPTRRKSP